MKIINSIQLMLIYTAMPFIITWVKGNDFYAHMVLFWVLIIVYLISFAALTALVSENLDK